jgi:isocitrate/isopropylmalate dehydrogenase
MFAALFDIGAVKDKMLIQIPFDDEKFDPVCFAICKKKDERKLRRNNRDIEALTSSMKTGISAQAEVSVLADSSELEKDLLGNDLNNMVLKYLDIIDFVHVTDTYLSTPTLGSKVVRIQVDSTSKNAMEALNDIVNLACKLIDQVSNLRLTAISKKNALKKRELLTEQINKIAKEEMAEKMKEEKLRK